jgi:hypothetical protein
VSAKLGAFGFDACAIQHAIFAAAFQHNRARFLAELAHDFMRAPGGPQMHPRQPRNFGLR